ncbi:MAG: hypothetical protein PT936_03590 [Treponema sp.]|nr:hypothetical protein [Treponema sp.]
MKLGKKLMVVAMAVATFGLVGCNMNEDEYHIIDFDAPGERAEINYTNEGLENKDATDGFIRGWATFNTGHKTVNCTITFDDTKSNTDVGNMGFVWNMTENNKTYSFYVISFKSASAGKLQYYISYYDKVGADYLSTTLKNFADKEGNEITTNMNSKTGAVEKKIEPTDANSNWTDAPSSSFNYDSTTGKITVFVKLDFDENTGYAVSFGTDGENLLVKKTGLTENVKKEGSIYKLPDAKMGSYAMVKPGCHLVGSWQFSDIKGNPLPIEELEY